LLVRDGAGRHGIADTGWSPIGHRRESGRSVAVNYFFNITVPVIPQFVQCVHLLCGCFWLGVTVPRSASDSWASWLRMGGNDRGTNHGQGVGLASDGFTCRGWPMARCPAVSWGPPGSN